MHIEYMGSHRKAPHDLGSNVLIVHCLGSMMIPAVDCRCNHIHGTGKVRPTLPVFMRSTAVLRVWAGGGAGGGA